MPLGMVEESQYYPLPLRPKPPELEFPPPDCPICGGPLDYDDGWDCHPCQATWDGDGRRGKYVDWDGKVDPNVACLSVLAPYEDVGPEYESIRHLRLQCARPAGHDGRHGESPYGRSWGHDNERIVHHSIEDAEYHGVNPDLTPLVEED